MRFLGNAFRRIVGDPISAKNRDANWYFAKNKSGKVHQIVLMSDPKHKSASRFSTLVFTPVYAHLMSGPFALGFFSLDHDPGPYLMIRTDGVRGDGYEAVDAMADEEFRVGLSFVQLPPSGLVAVYVSNNFLKRNTRMGYLEQIYGLDSENTRSLVANAITKDALQIVLAGEGGATPRCKYDITLPLDAACKERLAAQWKAVLNHHLQIARPDFQSAGRILYELIPERSDPILPAH
jgi:hypothetical protein